ncbi:MAG: amidinotransferase, partial [Thermococcus sp.]|nr:amidinotransferase [Thermococcus sp.]
ISVPISKIFHLLSGVNYLGNKTVVISPHVVDIEYFKGFKFITIAEDELYANNMLYLGERKVLLPAGYPKTEEKLRREGFKPVLVNVSEFWKGDGGVTCLNLPFYKPL